MSETRSAAAHEWRRYFMLPLAAAAGYATSVIHIYGLGPYIEPISQEFAWSRTQTTVGLTLSTAIQAVASVPIGLLVDRIGPRLLGVVGALLTAAAFALLSTATGDAANWYLLWGIMALATLPVQATIWTSAVASRFDASRGLAFAVTLCGASVAAALFPYLGSRLIDSYGWRTAMIGQAALWILIAWPLIFLFFRGAHEERRRSPSAEVAPVLSGTTLAQGMRSTVYWRLLFASLLFTFTIIALTVHFVPILGSRDIPALEAAAIASLIGLMSIAGRLGTGLLLDRFPGSVVGGSVFLLPMAGCLLLIMLASGGGHATAMVAAALIGLTLGAEVDVVVYLTTKHFGLKSFGALYGGLLAALSIGTATGPLGASAVFDATGSYDPFLWATIVLAGASSLALFSLPRPAFAGH